MLLKGAKKLLASFLLYLLFFICIATAGEETNVDFNPFGLNPVTNKEASDKIESGPVIPQVEFNNNDISMAFQIISDATGWSIFPSPDVSKAKISLWAKNISAAQLLDTVVTMAGFIHHRKGNTITVMTYDEYMQYQGLAKKVFTPKFANASSIEDAIKPFLTKLGKTRVHKETNTIILYDTDANLEFVSPIIEKLDSPGETSSIEVITLQYANAETISRMLNQVFVENKKKETNVAEPNTGSTSNFIMLSQQIGIFPVIHSNQLVIVGSQVTVQKVKELVTLIDIPSDNMILKVIDLQFADAEQIAQTLQQMFEKDRANKEEEPSPSTTSRENVQSMTAQQENKEKFFLNPRSQVGIYAVGRSNQLIIKAFRADIEMIMKLIEQLDTYVEPLSKNYQFTYVDVKEIYPGLERIMNIYGGYSSASTSNTNQGQGRSSYGRCGISIVEKNNAILLTGPPSTHRIMTSIQESIDKPSAFEVGMIRIYRIENADVEEIARTVTELLNAQQKEKASSNQPQFNKGTPEPSQPQLTNESPETFTDVRTSVSISKSTNSIIVQATARQQREIEKLIKELDIRRKQVIIEAKIVEITTTNDFDLGVELSHASNDKIGFTAFGLSRNLDPLTGIRDITVRPGGTAAVIKPDDVEVILHALSSVGNVTISSAPQILVNDNAVGVINSIAERPYTTTSQGVAGNVTSFGGFAEAGTVFIITPHISKEKYLRVEYKITLNAFTAFSTDPSIPPPRSTSSIQSEATVPDGFTIIVGGLQQVDENKSVDKVPLIGDIPVLGLAFRNTSITKQYKTTYLFITPRIISQEGFEDLKEISSKAVNEVETSKSENINSDTGIHNEQ